MRINKLILGMIALGLGLSSCNLDSDQDNNYQSFSLPCANLVIPDNGAAFATNANYTLAFYYYAENVTVSTNNLSLGTGGAYTFASTAMPFKTQLFDYNGSSRGVNSFSGGTASASGLSVSNIKGFTSTIFNVLSTNDPMNPMYVWNSNTPLVMSYRANDCTVKTFMPDAIFTGPTTIASPGAQTAPFNNKDIRYRVIFDNDFKKADIIFYNAKFAEAMPVTINFVLQDLDVTFNNNGYIISNPEGQSVTPSLYDASGLTPAPNYQFTSFEFINSSDDLTVANAMYTVQIGPASYNGTFNGYYVLSGLSEE